MSVVKIAVIALIAVVLVKVVLNKFMPSLASYV